MLLVESYLHHRSALRASLRAEYRISLGDLPVLETADLAAWLPAGSALWRAVGGPQALSESDHLLRIIDYRLQVLAWQQTKDGQHNRNRPVPPKDPPYASEVSAAGARQSRKAQAFVRRHGT